MATISRAAVVDAVLNGDTLIVYRDHLLRITDNWLDAHPGGSLALLHFVGRDATDEIEAYHSDKTLSLISRYAIGMHGAWAPNDSVGLEKVQGILCIGADEKEHTLSRIMEGLWVSLARFPYLAVIHAHGSAPVD
ncbi:hypothetical protein NMY22_g16212 [Coprinellus aureogranulatus]|nr:hypothetical protein NMY22_g16212 [Coprinellus aureogranulatus]